MPSDESTKIKRLSKELQDKVRSGIAIVNVAQCVEELVYNSIDAGATKIYVGLNINTFKVEVEDNGRGLSRADLEHIGKRYATSRCSSEKDLKNPTYYGFRGEALASIISVSRKVKIVCASQNGTTFTLRFTDGEKTGKIEEGRTKSSRSEGVAVVVEGLLDSQPVRQRRIDSAMQTEDVKSALEHIALINPNISIECRNEVNMVPLLKYKSCLSHSEAFEQLFGTKLKGDFNFTSENHLQDGLLFNGVIALKMFRQKCYQFVFVNRRCVQSRMKLHRTMNDTLVRLLGSEVEGRHSEAANNKLDKFPVFILSITCSTEKYYSQGDSKFSVDFWDWEGCLKGVEGLILKLQRRRFPNSSALEVQVSPRRNAKVSKRDKSGTEINTSKRQDLDYTTADTSPVLTGTKKANVTIDDMKGAIKSRMACRKSQGMPDDDGPMSSSRVNKSRAARLDASLSPRSTPSDLTTTFTNIPDSASQMNFRLPSPMRKKSTAKHTVYKIKQQERVSKSSTKRSGPPRKEIILPKKPLLTRNIFKNFPSWQEARKKEGTKTNESLTPDYRRRIPKYDSLRYVPKNNFPLKRLSESHSKSSIAKQKRQEQESRTTLYEAASDIISPVLHRKKEERSDGNGVEDDEYSWRINHWQNVSESKGSSKKETVVRSPSASVVSTKETKNEHTSNLNITNDTSTSSAAERIHRTFATSSQRKSATGSGKEKRNNKIEDVPKFNLYDVLNSSEGGKSRDGGLFQDICQKLQKDIVGKYDFPLDTQQQLPPPIVESTNPTSVQNTEDTEQDWEKWDLDVVVDLGGREWLQVEEEGKIVFINLSDGERRCNIDAIFSRHKTNASNIPRNRRNWLRRYFPKGCDNFWPTLECKKPIVNGNVHADTKFLSEDVRKTIFESMEVDPSSIWDKWKQPEKQDVGEVSEYFLDPIKEQPLNLVNRAGLKPQPMLRKPIKFSREDLNRTKVICQWDKKFILARMTVEISDGNEFQPRKSWKELVVAFDQHAVHERVRLEKLLELAHEIDSTTGQRRIASAAVSPISLPTLSSTENRMLLRYPDVFKNMGWTYDVDNISTIKFKSVPLCLFRRCQNEARDATQLQSLLQSWLTRIIEEQVRRMTTVGVNANVTLPNSLFNVLCSEACHGAIKFGDELDLKSCEELINLLKGCKTPFQCAHGRPSVVPLMDDTTALHFNDKNKASNLSKSLNIQPPRASTTSTSIINTSTTVDSIIPFLPLPENPPFSRPESYYFH